MKQLGNLNRVMEADTISKNGRSLKSHTSRKNILRMSVLLCVLFCVSAGAWGQTYKFTYNSGSTTRELLVDISNFSLSYKVSVMGDVLYNRQFPIKEFSIKNVEQERFIQFNLEDNIYDVSYCLLFEDKAFFTDSKTEIDRDYTITHKNSQDFYILYKAAETVGRTTTTPSTHNTQSASGKIEKVWLEHNVYKNGEYGMNIHIHFTINNMKGKTGVLCASIYDSNDKSVTFQCSGNGPNASGSIKPPYDSTEYSDYVIFKGYSSFQSLPRGKTDLIA